MKSNSPQNRFSILGVPPLFSKDYWRHSKLSWTTLDQITAIQILVKLVINEPARVPEQKNLTMNQSKNIKFRIILFIFIVLE